MYFLHPLALAQGDGQKLAISDSRILALPSIFQNCQILRNFEL